MKKVIFVAGPPGSGKTEFINQYYLNKYKVFDFDTYRKENKQISINNPLSYSENTTKSAGLMMNKNINSSLENTSIIVIEATFSSYDNTLEQIKILISIKFTHIYLCLMN